MKKLVDAQSIKEWRAQLSSHDSRPLIGLVPTMGFLHEGHLALIREAKRLAQYVVVSLFVNPTQFNQKADFESYPRDEEHDMELAGTAGADAMFIPRPEVIYPVGAQTWVNVEALAENLCGSSRPGHFQGVCTVVTALFNLVGCQLAVFGEKDYQQLAIIRQMTRDLHLPVQIIACPTYREETGLAMSSRNARLSAQGRIEASTIYQALSQAQTLWQDETSSLLQIDHEIKRLLSNELVIDYLQFCHPQTLKPYSLDMETDHEQELLVAIACFIEGVRLIDNIILTPKT